MTPFDEDDAGILPLVPDQTSEKGEPARTLPKESSRDLKRIGGGGAAVERSLFLNALEIKNEAERNAYLGKACQGAPGMRERIEKLLQVESRDSFLKPGETVRQIKADASGRSEPGGAVEHYDVGTEIARGGMGSIREAWDSKLRRTVAIKVMHWDAAASPAARTRFVREAEILAHLEHPNIVPIHDIVWEGEKPLFYSMKLVKGRTLQGILNDLRNEVPEAIERFTLDRLLGIFRKVCDAIAFAHSQGVIHRDLKPENIMVGEFGEVLVMDWGIAKSLGKPATTEVDAEAAPQPEFLYATMQGDVMGTPQYMSPEQAAGNIEELDQRSDIFSLGGILYAILTLRPPVEGTTLAEMLDKVSRGEITPPTEIHTTTRKKPPTKKVEIPELEMTRPLPHISGGRVPPSLSSVVMKALSLPKGGRYQMAEDLAADIDSYQRGFATRAEDPGNWKHLTLFFRRHRAISLVAAAAVILLGVLSIGGPIVAARQTRLAEIAEGMSEELRSALYVTKMNLAGSMIDGPGAAARISQYLGETSPSVLQADYRGWEWHFMNAVANDAGMSRDYASHCVDWTNDGRFLATGLVSEEGMRQFGIWNANTGELLHAFMGGMGICSDVSWNPNGTQFLYVNRSTDGSIFDRRKGRKVQILDDQFSLVGDWSPDGNLIAGYDREKGIQIIDFRSRKTLRLIDLVKGSLLELAWCPDSQRIAVVTNWSNLYVFDQETGKSLFEKEDFAASLTWSPDGSHLATVSLLGEMRILETSSWTVVNEFSTRMAPEPKIAWAPKGNLIATSNASETVFVWHAFTGRKQHELRGMARPAQALKWSPDGTRIAAVGRGLRIWSLSDNRPITDISVSSSKSERPGFVEESPDGRFLAMSSDEKTVVISRRDSGETVAEFDAGEEVTRLSWSPVGNFFVVGGHRVYEVWETGTWQRIHREDVDYWRINSEVAWSPDEKFLVKGELTHISILEVPTFETVREIDVKSSAGNVYALDWSADGKWLAVGGATCRVAIYVPETGELHHLFPEQDGLRIDSIAWHPDSDRIAAGNIESSLDVYSLSDESRVTSLEGHSGIVHALAWNPDGSRLASGGEDQSVRIWNVEIGEELLRLGRETGAVTDLDWSDDGNRVISASVGGNAVIWDAFPKASQAATP